MTTAVSASPFHSVSPGKAARAWSQSQRDAACRKGPLLPGMLLNESRNWRVPPSSRGCPRAAAWGKRSSSGKRAPLQGKGSAGGLARKIVPGRLAVLPFSSLPVHNSNNDGSPC
ncbi:Hypothetical predicted protein [Podarcis lilfordi]|uniref:Uncharacterized protein n=1 Tax=Podarcis lilfordi TaxID=74358 RepID=A0AA35P3W8_9SAUR|nr:Hypothetical predicted protein [Podarcis lilfordi]